MKRRTAPALLALAHLVFGLLYVAPSAAQQAAPQAPAAASAPAVPSEVAAPGAASPGWTGAAAASAVPDASLAATHCLPPR